RSLHPAGHPPACRAGRPALPRPVHLHRRQHNLPAARTHPRPAHPHRQPPASLPRLTTTVLPCAASRTFFLVPVRHKLLRTLHHKNFGTTGKAMAMTRRQFTFNTMAVGATAATTGPLLTACARAPVSLRVATWNLASAAPK